MSCGSAAMRLLCLLRAMTGESRTLPIVSRTRLEPLRPQSERRRSEREVSRTSLAGMEILLVGIKISFRFAADTRDIHIDVQRCGENSRRLNCRWRNTQCCTETSRIQQFRTAGRDLRMFVHVAHQRLKGIADQQGVAVQESRHNALATCASPGCCFSRRTGCFGCAPGRSRAQLLRHHIGAAVGRVVVEADHSYADFQLHWR